MAINNSKFTLVNLCLGISMVTDHWGIGRSLRELGTKPLLLIFVIFLIANFLLIKKKITFNKNYLKILIISLVLCLSSVYMNGAYAINQSILLLFVISTLSLEQENNINPKRIMEVFLIGHIFFLSSDFIFDISNFRNNVIGLIKFSSNERGLFSEHSWSAMIIGALPIYYLGKPLKFYFIFLTALFYVIFLVNSGTGILALFLSGFLFFYRFLKSGKKMSLRLIMIITIVITTVTLTINSNRFSISYNESNATRLLIPYNLIYSGLENYFLGVGINGQLQYLIENSYSELSFLSEFQNNVIGNANNRFNSFSLYLRLWSSFGILGMLISYRILLMIHKNLFNPDNLIVLLSVLALISTLSNDSFNNVYLILLILAIKIKKTRKIVYE